MASIPVLFRAYLRYEGLNLKLSAPRDSKALGALRERGVTITSICLQDHRTQVQGVVSPDAGAVSITARGAEAFPRRLGAGDFSLSFPGRVAAFVVTGDPAQNATAFALRGVAWGGFAVARLRMMGQFAGRMIGVLPQVWHFLRGEDPLIRERLKFAMGLVRFANANALDPRVLMRGDSTADCPFDRVAVVVPVYNSLSDVQDCLQRLLAHTDLALRVCLVEDASSDPQVRPWLRDWHAALPCEQRRTVDVLENPHNLGFIGSVNRGIAHLRDTARAGVSEPVVLLNTDAMVPQNWATRLLAPLADENVASVTPFSNDAELMSVPLICARRALGSAQVSADAVAQAVDLRAAQIPRAVAVLEVITGVGFCMALSPRALALEPAFDPAFGRGYGEEVDWCQKLRARGLRHVSTAQLFVEHRGGASFGSADKAALLAQNGAIIAKRYVGYDAEVARAIADDAQASQRMVLGLAMAAAECAGRVAVFVAHSLGGGAEHDLQKRLARCIARSGHAVVLRIGGPTAWRVELCSAQGQVVVLSQDTAAVIDLLSDITAPQVVYNCAVGATAPQDVVALMRSLGARGDLCILMHDFYPLSPSFNLLDSDGIYRGVPLVGGASDAAHDFDAGLGLSDWRALWGGLLAQAREIEVFSQSSAAIVAEVYPDSAAQIVVRPHNCDQLPKRLSAPRRATGAPLVVGVLGNIGPQKGAQVLRALCQQIALAQVPMKLVIIGDVDPRYDLPGAKVHGAYRLGDIEQLVNQYGISRWLMPSIWPETFCFTVHEMLATGLPVLGFDLGAQAEALRAFGLADNLMPVPRSDTDVQRLIARLEVLS
ncbi:Glycosyl transferase family 2 [Aquimixticola soesokkakensis]|uniref:Glycosyl transferase family 2 n=1 Tax=Aquimixticola soesokkakensis TaxID=1519096 RepID=A0A1Y5RI24_9RHOB|nr:glycosyltransferase [Aquimixticola soesokkakensis]SLN15344.1 Glycosyl transferase family 2 [Aquimixticola soesokkakensis]